MFPSFFRSSLRLAAIAVVAATFVGASIAFTDSNAVPTTSVGEGAEVISGYTSTNVNYALNASDPRKVDLVTFNLDRTPSALASIRVSLVSNGSTWYTCTNSGAAVSCPTTVPQALAATVDELRLIVAN